MLNRSIQAILLTLLLASAAYPKCGVPTTHRGEKARLQFMKTTPQPDGHLYPRGRKGWVVDHIIPLCKGGPDTPENMQWQTKADAKIKDKVECKCDVPIFPHAD